MSNFKDYDEIKEKVLLHDIKMSDHDAKINLILRASKGAKKSRHSVNHVDVDELKDEAEGNTEPVQSGIGLDELLAVID